LIPLAKISIASALTAWLLLSLAVAVEIGLASGRPWRSSTPTPSLSVGSGGETECGGNK